MRAHKMIALACALGLLAVAPVADAASKPKPKPVKRYCDLLTDTTGDGHLQNTSQVGSPSIDITGGDLATGSTTMVAVLRVASLDLNLASDPFLATGYNWSFGANSSLGQSYDFYASASGTKGITGTASIDKADVGTAVTFAVSGNSLIWTLKRSAAPHLSRPKNVFDTFRASSSMDGIGADRAPESGTTKVPYPDRAPSCVLAK